MTIFKTFRETALPGTLEPYAIYFIAPAARPDYTEIYITGASAATVKRVINEVDVQALIDTAIASVGALEVVDNIAARNALTPTNNAQVLVLDASADETVASGSATYVYRFSTTTWIKVSESESMDVVLQWSNIQGRPSSSVADIDDAVTKKHAHTNKTQLDKVGEDGNGNLTYNGALPKIAWDSTGW